MTSMNCARAVFPHHASCHITIAYTDQAFDDDSYWSGTGSRPLYALSRMVPDFGADHACSTKTAPNAYDVRFYFTNLTDIEWDNMTITCAISGGVLTSTTATLGTIPPGTGNYVDLHITVNPAANKNVFATLLFSDGNPYDYASCIFDLYPAVILTSQSTGLSLCPGAIDLRLQAVVCGLSMDNLVATFSSPQVSTWTDFFCNPGNTVTVGATTGCTAFNVQIEPVRTSTPAIITIAWTDGALTFPSSVIPV